MPNTTLRFLKNCNRVREARRNRTPCGFDLQGDSLLAGSRSMLGTTLYWRASSTYWQACEISQGPFGFLQSSSRWVCSSEDDKSPELPRDQASATAAGSRLLTWKFAMSESIKRHTCGLDVS